MSHSTSDATSKTLMVRAFDVVLFQMCRSSVALDSADSPSARIRSGTGEKKDETFLAISLAIKAN